MKLQLSLLVVCLSVLVVLAKSQTCYYPNGDSSKENDIPCSSASGSACCPQGWACLDNGLCYLDNQKYFGRYTCTDKSWKSSGCPQICTHSNTATGNEAILQCSKGNYCCDANRPTVGCCDTGATQFPLNDGKVISSGSNSGSSVNNPPSAPSSSSGGSAPSSSSSSTPPSSSSSSSSSTPPSAPSSSTPQSSSSAAQSSFSNTQTLSQTASGNNNGGGSTSLSSGGGSTSSSSQSSQSSQSVSIITSVVTSISGSNTVTSSATTAVPIMASGTPSPASTQKNLGGIIGPAVGVPVAVLALSAFAYFLWKRRRNNKRSNPQRSMTPPVDDTKTMGYGKPEPDNLLATPDMARYSGNTLTQSPRFLEFAGSPELAGNYPQHYDPQRPQAGELPGSMYHPYNPNLPRELPA